MKYKDTLTEEAIDKSKPLYAEVELLESSIGDDILVKKPFKLTNALPNVVKDESAEEELDAMKKELNKVKSQRRELKKEVKELKKEIDGLLNDVDELSELKDFDDEGEE